MTFPGFLVAEITVKTEKMKQKEEQMSHTLELWYSMQNS